MVTPGLLPEASDRRPSAWPFTLALLGIALVGGCTYLVVRTVRLRAERDELLALLQERTKDLGELEKALKIQELALQRTKKISDAVAEAPAVSSSPSSAPAPDVRVVSPASREQAQERITQGLHEFRSGRYLQAELAFLRAVPEAYGYIVLTCFVRGDVREAVVFLGRALAADPEWLRRIRPRDLFGDAADYEKALRALEERVAADPLDPEAKSLLAYLHYHEKGPEYAKALAVEATNARPEHAEARQLLQALGDKSSR